MIDIGAIEKLLADVGPIARERARATLQSTRSEFVYTLEAVQSNARGVIELLGHADTLVAEVRRLEGLALLQDANRCDACQRVFDIDEGEYGEDCWLCKGCAAAARTEVVS